MRSRNEADIVPASRSDPGGIQLALHEGDWLEGDVDSSLVPDDDAWDLPFGAARGNFVMATDVYAAAAVMIECPRSRSLVPTGAHVLSVDELTPTDLLLDCPDCGRDHPWGPADAVLLSGAASGARRRRPEASIGSGSPGAGLR